MSLRKILAAEGLIASAPPPAVLAFAKAVTTAMNKGGASLRKDGSRWIVDLPGWPNISSARINRLIGPRVKGLGVLSDPDISLYDVAGTPVMVMGYGSGSGPHEGDTLL